MPAFGLASQSQVARPGAPGMMAVGGVMAAGGAMAAGSAMGADSRMSNGGGARPGYPQVGPNQPPNPYPMHPPGPP